MNYPYGATTTGGNYQFIFRGQPQSETQQHSTLPEMKQCNCGIYFVGNDEKECKKCREKVEL